MTLAAVKNDTETNEPKPMNVGAFVSNMAARHALEDKRDEYLTNSIDHKGNVDLYWVERALRLHSAIVAMTKKD